MQTPVPIAPLAPAEPPIVSSVADAAMPSARGVSARVKLSLVLVYAVWSSTYLALRIVVEATNGLDHARIFEVRVYEV